MQKYGDKKIVTFLESGAIEGTWIYTY